MTTDAVGGVWQYSVNLARQLSNQDFEILLATLGPAPSQRQLRQAREPARLRVEQGNFGLEWMPNAWRDVDRSGEWLLSLQRAFEPDLVHLNGYAHATLNWSTPVLVVAHSCVFSWWRAVRGGSPGDEWSEYKRRVAAGLAACDQIVAPSATMAQAIEREYGVPRDRIGVIYNFADSSGTRIPKEPYFLCAGRMWDAAKNLQLLESIAPQLSWPLRVAGDLYDPHKKPNVEFLGRLDPDAMRQQMQSAAIFAHPALYEPFGLSVLEAALSSCCLVLSDIPSLRELWEGAAVFVDARDRHAWIRELNRLTNDGAERNAWAERAAAHALRYSPEAAWVEYLRVYSEMTTRDKRKSGAAA